MRQSVTRTVLFVARFAVIGLALAFVLSVLAPRTVERLRGSASDNTSCSGSPSTCAQGNVGPVSYAEAVTRASPAVVNIYANKISTVRQYQYRLVPDPLTQRLLGAISLGPAYKRRDQSLGSGVIFRADGYVLTNNHVITGADDIQVLLDDGRVAKARVIGTDVWTDLAVLKIDLKDLPTIAVANKGAVNVGDVVLAIGNPVGIGKTVTMGIVSATARQLRLSAYEDFIQTDAAINAGNSGGALVDALGELVGINTAIYPRAPGGDNSGNYVPGTEGIGFAIPVATATAVLNQIIEHGMVIRGWIGAEYAEIPLPNGASVQPHGVVIAEVYNGGPAAVAGMRAGDILLTLDGEPIGDQADLRNREATIKPGTTVKIAGMRGNVPITFDLALAQRPEPGTSGT